MKKIRIVGMQEMYSQLVLLCIMDGKCCGYCLLKNFPNCSEGQLEQAVEIELRYDLLIEILK